MYIVILDFGEVFFRKTVTVISIFFTQLLGCFGLNLVLLRGAKLKHQNLNIYVCRCDVIIHCMQNSALVGESRSVTKSEKIFQSLSSLSPCRLCVETPV